MGGRGGESAFFADAEYFTEDGAKQRRGFYHNDLHNGTPFGGCLVLVYAAGGFFVLRMIVWLLC